MFHLVLKFKFRMCNDCWRRRMTKVWDSQLGDSLVKQHSAFLYFFWKSCDRWRGRSNLLRPKGGGGPWPNGPPYKRHWEGFSTSNYGHPSSFIQSPWTLISCLFLRGVHQLITTPISTPWRQSFNQLGSNWTKKWCEVPELPWNPCQTHHQSKMRLFRH